MLVGGAIAINGVNGGWYVVAGWGRSIRVRGVGECQNGSAEYRASKRFGDYRGLCDRLLAPGARYRIAGMADFRVLTSP